MQLTKNFTLSELMESAKARELGIDNSIPPLLMGNAKALAERLQIIRDVLRAPVYISSGYRCEALNKAVGGAYTSQHLLSLAADIHAQGYTASQLFGAIQKMNISYDQLILERVGLKEWVHISVQPYERNEKLGYTNGVYIRK
jgi:zinc D-Ala-D-Ala carboxypeptidase